MFTYILNMLLYVLHAFCYIDLFFRIVDVLADYYQKNALCMLFTKCFVYSMSWSPYAKWKGYQLEWWCAGEWISGFCLSLLSVWMKASLRSEVWNACFILFFFPSFFKLLHCICIWEVFTFLLSILHVRIDSFLDEQ